MKKIRDISKVYLKKFSEVSGFKVWIVDGKYIRDNLDEEFTNFGQHYRFKFIPKNEFWIDKQRTPGEENYFIDFMFAIERLISKGMGIKEAWEIAHKIEKRERSKSQLMKKEMQIKKAKGDLTKTVYKNPLKEYSNEKIKVWVVNGELVRDLFFLDFTEGGHDKVYDFIPENEIWIDDDLALDERGFVLLHELHERNLMTKGMVYNSAHKDSSRIEYFCRKHPKMLNECIRKEFKKIKNI